MSTPIRVLVVDDEPLIAEAHKAYVGKVEGLTSSPWRTPRARR
jgi:response regulator of citrate/malate metabolism